MRNQPLQYYMHDGSTAFRFELAGNLNHEGARRLDQDWRTASSVIGDRTLIVDMTFVTGVDEQGRALITRWHREGARLIANTKASRALAESILGEPLAEPPSNARATLDRTWLPFRSSFVASAVNLVLLLAPFVFPVKTNGATLKSETVDAWDDYLQTASANLQARVRRGGSFLWTFENAARAAEVCGGKIIVVPAPVQNPKKVPGGLIHHWMGAMFLPNVKRDEILEVTRDYDRYGEFYRPSVIDSKVIARGNSDDRFSMLLMNKALFLRAVLDADYYHVTNVRLDESRFYSISTATRIQEIEEYGQPGEHQVAEGEGSGFMWKLYSIARLEQCDNGVYVELDAIALSRDIPAVVRFAVDPIVRRVSRNSLLISMQQTEAAVGGRFAEVARSAGVPASVEQLSPVSAPSNKSTAPTRDH